MGPFELTGPHRQPEQDEGNAAWSWERAADETEGNQKESENADRDAIDDQLALVLPDLATPAPAVLFGLDEDVVVVIMVIVMPVQSAGPVRDRHAARCNVTVGTVSVGGVIILDAG